ncbi:helix-turn-helix domain-containing protein [Christiangramia crocea]|uniref:Helix-turn-helix domain-containing protein n=1 Tax=Christiangramia crocea TaxID=2904124 RepID=A0A9X1UU94_9FLAO|nr:helix-turn-helix domain-containing protein [Gramella crocea]MCG9970358.1 helix-turn-helix domain-containing protein [Gramella crocea]
MEEILKVESISQYNALKEIATRHPLITSFDSSTAKPLSSGKYRFEFYAIFLKGVNCGELKYGRSSYDYEEGTLVFMGPGQVVGIKSAKDYNPKGNALLFHPDFIKGTSLAEKMHTYSFFSYELNEALHISEKEQQIIKELFSKIDYELDQNIDKHSKTIIANNIELLLNYCDRFYDRQFITRENLNQGIVSKFERLLNDYFQSENPQKIGLPSVSYFAEALNLSPNYFGDLIKKETGKSAIDHIHLKLIDVAKDRIFDTEKSISQIAYELGFKYPQHFNRMFKKNTGCTPNEYRLQN